MGATTPIEVGTRGTVASLVMREIEYFRGLESDSRKPREHIAGTSSGRSNTNSWFSFGFMIITRRRKKRRGGSGIIPRMCSAVEVADSGFDYRNLNTDVEKYEL